MGDVINLKPPPKPRQRRKDPTKAELLEESRRLKDATRKRDDRDRKRAAAAKEADTFTADGPCRDTDVPGTPY